MFSGPFLGLRDLWRGEGDFHTLTKPAVQKMKPGSIQKNQHILKNQVTMKPGLPCFSIPALKVTKPPKRRGDSEKSLER